MKKVKIFFCLLIVLFYSSFSFSRILQNHLIYRGKKQIWNLFQVQHQEGDSPFWVLRSSDNGKVISLVRNSPKFNQEDKEVTFFALGDSATYEYISDFILDDDPDFEYTPDYHVIKRGKNKMWRLSKVQGPGCSFWALFNVDGKIISLVRGEPNFIDEEEVAFFTEGERVVLHYEMVQYSLPEVSDYLGPPPPYHCSESKSFE